MAYLHTQMVRLKCGWGIGLLLAFVHVAAAVCPSNSTTFYGPAAAEYCICNSASYYSGASCLTNTLCTALPNNVNINTEASVINTTLNLVTKTLEIQLQIAASTLRNYTGFQLGNCSICDISNTTGCYSGLTGFQVLSPNDATCMDTWRLFAPMQQLAGCGFSQSNNVAYNGGTYQLVSGDMRIRYAESIDIGVAYTRQLNVVLPVQLYFQQLYAANVSAITVQSNYSLSAGVVVRSIQTDATTSSVQLSYLVQRPYQVLSFNRTLTVTGTNAGTVTAAFVDPQTLAPYPSPPNNAENCTNLDYNLASYTCSKTLTVLLNHNGTCRLDGTFTMTGINVGCGSQILASDCPLTGSEAASSISFTLVSEYFCSDVTPFQLNNVLSFDRFITPNNKWLKRDTNNNQNQTAWQYNTYLWMRMDLNRTTLAAQNATLIRVETDWCSAYGATPIYFTVYDASIPGLEPPASIWNLPFDTSGYSSYPTGGRLGLDVTDQSFLVAHLISTAFASSTNSTQTACAAEPSPGATVVLNVRLTVDFSYYIVPTGRRRRRVVADVSGADNAQSRGGQTGSASLERVYILPSTERRDSSPAPLTEPQDAAAVSPVSSPVSSEAPLQSSTSAAPTQAALSIATYALALASAVLMAL